MRRTHRSALLRNAVSYNSSLVARLSLATAGEIEDHSLAQPIVDDSQPIFNDVRGEVNARHFESEDGTTREQSMIDQHLIVVNAFLMSCERM